jgi:T5SS/PEP-CTERM-associated repeat protein
MQFVLAIAAMALCASPTSRAAALCDCVSRWILQGVGDWFDSSNWDQDGVPNCGGTCHFGSEKIEADIGINGISGTAKISTTTAAACEVFLGYSSTDSGTLSVENDGTLSQCNDVLVGWYGKGTLNIANGGVVSSDGTPSIAFQTGSTGSVTVDGQNPDGTKSQWTMGGGLYVGGSINGQGGTGLLKVTNSATVTAASVYVYGSGTLTGNSTVNTTNGVTIAGTIQPSGGRLTIAGGGDLTFNGNTALMVSNVVPGSADNVYVSNGRALLTGKLKVTMTGNFTPGDTYTLLHADNGLNNTRFQFDSINYPTCECFAPKITYDDQHGNVNLYLDPVPCCQ